MHRRNSEHMPDDIISEFMTEDNDVIWIVDCSSQAASLDILLKLSLTTAYDSGELMIFDKPKIWFAPFFPSEIRSGPRGIAFFLYHFRKLFDSPVGCPSTEAEYRGAEPLCYENVMQLFSKMSSKTSEGGDHSQNDADMIVLYVNSFFSEKKVLVNTNLETDVYQTESDSEFCRESGNSSDSGNSSSSRLFKKESDKKVLRKVRRFMKVFKGGKDYEHVTAEPMIPKKFRCLRRVLDEMQRFNDSSQKKKKFLLVGHSASCSMKEALLPHITQMQSSEGISGRSKDNIKFKSHRLYRPVQISAAAPILEDVLSRSPSILHHDWGSFTVIRSNIERNYRSFSTPLRQNNGLEESDFESHNLNHVTPDQLENDVFEEMHVYQSFGEVMTRSMVDNTLLITGNRKTSFLKSFPSKFPSAEIFHVTPLSFVRAELGATQLIVNQIFNDHSGPSGTHNDNSDEKKRNINRVVCVDDVDIWSCGDDSLIQGAVYQMVSYINRSSPASIYLFSYREEAALHPELMRIKRVQRLKLL